ncbi:MAG: replication initiation protein [Rhizobium sp.]|nr:MAG: replication initiation protein [Rhizobium sp.]
MRSRAAAKPNAAFLKENPGFSAGARAGDGASATAPARSAGSPRTVIRGESPTEVGKGGGAIVDWLRFTFLPEGSIGDELEKISRYLRLWFSIPVNVLPSKKGFRGYESSCDIRAYVNGEDIRLGIIAAGGDSVGGTMLVDLSGMGCAVVTDWGAVYATLQDLDARITRCDLAVDFLEGEVSIDQIESMYFAGEFNAGGRIPTYYRHESGCIGAEGKGGRTFEIGKRICGKMLRAYEKGRQLGQQDSDWVRVEVEFGNKGRVIPHEIVIKRDEYFVGAHRAMEQFLDAASERVKCLQRQAVFVVEKRIGTMRNQYGKSTDELMRHFQEDAHALIDAIRTKGVPRSMQKTALATHVYGAHDPAPVYQE